MWWRPKSLQSPKLARRKRRSFLFNLFLFVLIFSLLISGTVYLLKQPEVIIQNVVLTGNVTVPTEELESFIRDELNGNYFFIFPRSSIFLYPRRSIEGDVLLQFKKIEKVDVSFDSFNSILVSVEERKPSALWCGENRLEGAVPECFFLDDKGLLYTHSPSFTGDIYFRFYGPLGEGSSVGQQFLPTSTFQGILFFLQSLRELGINPVELAVGNDDDYELYLENGTQILFAQNGELSLILDNLQTTLLSDELKERSTIGIDYIDLRFGNKVYYKFIDE